MVSLPPGQSCPYPVGMWLSKGPRRKELSRRRGGIQYNWSEKDLGWEPAAGDTGEEGRGQVAHARTLFLKHSPGANNSFCSGNTLFTAGAQPSLITLFGGDSFIKLPPHWMKAPWGLRTVTPPKLHSPRAQHSEGIQSILSNKTMNEWCCKPGTRGMNKENESDMACVYIQGDWESSSYTICWETSQWIIKDNKGQASHRTSVCSGETLRLSALLLSISC